MENSNENFLINEGLELQYYRFLNHDLNKERRHCLLLFKVYVLILITRFENASVLQLNFKITDSHCILVNVFHSLCLRALQNFFTNSPMKNIMRILLFYDEL